MVKKCQELVHLDDDRMLMPYVICSNPHRLLGRIPRLSPATWQAMVFELGLFKLLSPEDLRNAIHFGEVDEQAYTDFVYWTIRHSDCKGPN
ncbi:hypothetical protein CYLTODRAFT_31360 [Cylindrobasidium torrendii FP15055 ss-10]|uniref:Uncharacterized protein n=1 Tax=Cylindrobasidium torrendii FP15055 ss-10 TaxID=1314674 RepID=A0A0D7B7I5_9AGAR|nr:hypothetical protein CYLTODRAFT_31360 [Cylindrobasidium torrendii FP15055 ss-10]